MGPVHGGEYALHKLEAPPNPPSHEPRPTLTLSQLAPGKYVDTVARVACVRVSERVDEMGLKPVLTGVLEDRTFKLPFVCHRISLPLTLNSVFKFKSVYVHEFEDKSLVIVLTEYSRVEPWEDGDPGNFFWVPRIGDIRRPVSDVTLTGIIVNVYSPSGLVKRCNRCGRIIEDVCPNGCGEGWSWDLRISAKLYDGSGSIRTIFTRHAAAKVLEKSLGEIMYLANTLKPYRSSGQESLSFKLKLPHEMEVVEAVVEDALSFRRSGRLIVPDGLTLLYFPVDEKAPPAASETSIKKLDPRNQNDSRIMRRLVEKALDVKIRDVTGKGFVHNIYLLEDPKPLYSCERAKLYLGFSIKVTLDYDIVNVEATPEALVRESVWDYIRWRRARGASANAIKKTLLAWRTNVLMAPFGRYGRIEEVVFEHAGEHSVSERDRRTLVDFWKEVYDVDVSPDEMPLLKVKPAESESLFTYPPSTLYFDENTVFIPNRIWNYVAGRKAALGRRVQQIMGKVIREVKIAGKAFELQEEVEGRVDVQRILLQEIHQKILGKKVRVRGSIVKVGGQLYLFPNSAAVI